MIDNYDYLMKALILLKKAKPYILKAHDDAENKHDSYGEYYMDSVQYEIMEDTDKLLSDIKEVLDKSRIIQGGKYD